MLRSPALMPALIDFPTCVRSRVSRQWSAEGDGAAYTHLVRSTPGDHVKPESNKVSCQTLFGPVATAEAGLTTHFAHLSSTSGPVEAPQNKLNFILVAGSAWRLFCAQEQLVSLAHEDTTRYVGLPSRHGLRELTAWVGRRPEREEAVNLGSPNLNMTNQSTQLTPSWGIQLR